jgi:CDP-diglyceride synthetase
VKERIITGIIMAILFLIPFYFGSYWFSAFSLILAIIAYYEFSTIIKVRILGIKWFVGLLGVIFLFSPLFSSGGEQIQIKVLIVLVLFFITATIFNQEFSIEKAGTLLIGVFIRKPYDVAEAASNKLLYVIGSRAKRNLHLFAETGRKTQSGSLYRINHQLGQLSFRYDSISVFPEVF